MRASGVLQRCLSSALSPMHALRRRTLLAAVESLLAGRRLVLMDLARSWIGAERVRAPLKRLDRLLSNRRLCAEREAIYAAMARWLVRHPRPVILVDWSDLKDDKSWHLLRAAVPVGGRSLTLLEMVFPGREQGAPQAERRFLQRLKAILPVDTCPILVTDAGFRAPWFRAVSDLGWNWVGRLRHRTLVKPVDVANTPEQWVPCRALYVLASTTPRDLGLMDTVRSAPWVCRMIVYGKAACGRKHRTRKGEIARGTASRKHAHREREPWLLVASPQLQLTARQLTSLYSRRMQIEASFRDLKSHRYGNAFEDSLTRTGSRLEILLLLNALATFASWLAGLACEASGIDQWLAPRRCRRRLYSVLRVGREALVRRWPIGVAQDLIDRLKSPGNHWLDQTSFPA